MLTVVLVIIAIVAFILVPGNPRPPLPTPVQINTVLQPTLGDPNATVQIVVFDDLKCMNCMRYDQTIYPKIEKNYINTHKIKYTVINLAFLPNSMPAANAAYCIYMQNQQAFFDFMHYIYAHQPPESENWACIPNLMDFALHIKNVDQNKFAQCVVKSPYTDVISNNLKIAQKAMGEMIATPSVYVNGVKVEPLTWDQLKYVMSKVS